MRILLGLMPSPEPFPAAPVLQELDSDTGRVIWMSLRAADLWMGVDVEVRGGLFGEGAERARTAGIDALEPLDPALGHALRVLAGVLGAPSVAGPQVASACAALARWADKGGWPRTAFEAAARGALAAPRDPAHALLAGTLAQRAADYPRAAAWAARAVRLARRAGDGASHANALLAMAQIHMVRGERAAAESTLRETIRVARRYGVWEVKPRAYHDLFCIQCTDGDVRTAAAYALAAAEGYGLHHERLAALAHDLALFLACHGRGRQALPLMQALAPRMSNPRLRLVAFSSMGRVAGRVGDRARFADAWTTVWTMLDQRLSEARAAEALINLAFGAAELGDTARVEVAAREALRIAEPRQEWQEVDAARAMLGALAEHRSPGPPPTAAGTDDELRDALAAAELLLDQLLHTPALQAAGASNRTDGRSSAALPVRDREGAHTGAVPHGQPGGPAAAV